MLTPNNEQTADNSIKNIIKLVYLTPKNAKFSQTANGFPMLKATVPNPEKENAVEELMFERIYLHRAFPYDDPDKYISVQGSFPKPPPPPKEEEKKDESTEEKKDDKAEQKKDENPRGEIREIGIISDLSVFSKEERGYINSELERKYFAPVLKNIESIKEKYGYSYWVVDTDVGEIKFTIHDTSRNVNRVDEDRVYITDINGNRYFIPSLEKFDKNSYKKIEIYL